MQFCGPIGAVALTEQKHRSRSRCGLSALRDKVVGDEIGSVCGESLELLRGGVGPVAIPQEALLSDITDGRDQVVSV